MIGSVMEAMKGLCTTALLLIAAASELFAAELKSSHQASSEFERMKSLVGSWKGKADMGGGPMEFTVEYRLVSGGSVLEERIFAGTPKEMVTMYFDQNGKLSLTHYCMLGNRPGMLLKAADAKIEVAAAQKKRSDEMFNARVITAQEHETAALDYANALAAVVRARLWVWALPLAYWLVPGDGNGATWQLALALAVTAAILAVSALNIPPTRQARA